MKSRNMAKLNFTFFMPSLEPPYSQMVRISLVPLLVPCIGVRILRSAKDCVRLGSMKGCPVMTRAVVFADEEELPYDQLAGTPHIVAYVPFILRLQADDVDRTLPQHSPASSNACLSECQG